MAEHSDQLCQKFLEQVLLRECVSVCVWLCCSTCGLGSCRLESLWEVSELLAHSTAAGGLGRGARTHTHTLRAVSHGVCAASAACGPIGELDGSVVVLCVDLDHKVLDLPQNLGAPELSGPDQHKTSLM